MILTRRIQAALVAMVVAAVVAPATLAAQTTSTPTPVEYNGPPYAGGGQSATVNSLIEFYAPTSRSTSLPAGTTSFDVVIIYHAGFDTGSLTATLNGVDIRSSFHPLARGGTETVTIPLVPGRNVLKLSAAGIVNGNSVKDSDTLVFSVQ